LTYCILVLKKQYKSCLLVQGSKFQDCWNGFTMMLALMCLVLFWE